MMNIEDKCEPGVLSGVQGDTLPGYFQTKKNDVTLTGHGWMCLSTGGHHDPRRS